MCVKEFYPILPNFHFMFFDWCWSHMLTNLQVMLLDRYWSHITKFPFHVSAWIMTPYLRVARIFIHVLCEILIPYSIPNYHIMFFEKYWSRIQNFQEFMGGNWRKFCLPPPFSQTINFTMSNILRFPKILFSDGRGSCGH